MPKRFYLPETSGSTIFIFTSVGNFGLFFLLLWLLLINMIVFYLFGLDKHRAQNMQKKKTRRIPERVFFRLAILGGSPGALIAMRVFHHKTRHKSFYLGIPIILITQVLLFFLIYIVYINI